MKTLNKVSSRHCWPRLSALTSASGVWRVSKYPDLKGGDARTWGRSFLSRLSEDDKETADGRLRRAIGGVGEWQEGEEGAHGGGDRDERRSRR